MGMSVYARVCMQTKVGRKVFLGLSLYLYACVFSVTRSVVVSERLVNDTLANRNRRITQTLGIVL